MRYPNTYTNKTLFIVVTTLLFHFIYYLIIPTMYLRFQEDSRGRILKVISNQTINFVIVHIIIAGFDLMYCCWNRRQQRVEDEERPIGCQKMLHESIEYPRFPM